MISLVGVHERTIAISGYFNICTQAITRTGNKLHFPFWITEGQARTRVWKQQSANQQNKHTNVNYQMQDTNVDYTIVLSLEGRPSSEQHCASYVS